MAKKSMILKQQAEPKFSSRRYNRCKLCGRPHAYLRNYGICRICFRELAYKMCIRDRGRGGRLVLGDPAVQALDQLDIQISHCKSPP